jgi:hypothetical protein
MAAESSETGGESSPEVQQQVYDKQYNRYTNGYGGRAYPPSYESLAIFLAHFASTHDGSSKSMANIMSAIRVFCRYAKLPWLNSDDSYLLSNIRKEICLEDPKPIGRKLPIKKATIKQGLRESMLGHLAGS